MMKPSRLFFVHLIFSFLPVTRFFALKRALLRWAGANIGANVRVVSTARFYLNGDLSIGEGSWIGHDVLVVGGNASVTIGSRVDIAPRVTIVTGTHELFSSPDRAAGAGYSLPVVIEEGAWLGAASVILGGVTVGKKSMIAAGALVNRNVLPSIVVGGVPSRVLSVANESVKK